MAIPDLGDPALLSLYTPPQDIFAIVIIDSNIFFLIQKGIEEKQKSLFAFCVMCTVKVSFS